MTDRLEAGEKGPGLGLARNPPFGAGVLLGLGAVAALAAISGLEGGHWPAALALASAAFMLGAGLALLLMHRRQRALAELAGGGGARLISDPSGKILVCNDACKALEHVFNT